MASKAGIVYILSNPAMPGLVKIGITTHHTVEQRMKELFNTSIPVPFKCEYACRVDNCFAVEHALHTAFRDYRIHPQREFFKIEPYQIKVILQLFDKGNATTEIQHDINNALSDDDIQSEEKLRGIHYPDSEQMGQIQDRMEEERNRNALYSVNGSAPLKMGPAARYAVQLFVKKYPMMTEEQAYRILKNLNIKAPHFIETRIEKERRLQNSQDKSGRERANEVSWANGVLYVTTEWTYQTFPQLMRKFNESNWEINIQQVE